MLAHESDESSAEDGEGEEECEGVPAHDTSEETELGEPSADSVFAPKEATRVLIQRFQALLRAGRHSSGTQYQLAVHAGRMNDRAPRPPKTRSHHARA